MIFDDIVGLLSRVLKISRDKVRSETRIVDDLGASTLDRALIMLGIYEEMNISIPLEEMNSIKTVADLVGAVEKQRNRRY